MRLLIVTATDNEARVLGRYDDAVVVVSGVGRTNAAAVTTEMIIRKGPFDAVLNVGLAGALPGSDLGVGDALVASQCVYVEEGLVTPHGFADMERLGFELGDFAGNAVPVDETLLDRLGVDFRIGPVATVATCSGTDAAAQTVVERTGALAEAMEGAAVVHAARRLSVPAVELRVISNTTGDRALQQWDLDRGLETLSVATGRAIALLQGR